jgi:putative membrane protein
VVGLCCAGAGLAGPLAAAHGDLRAHAAAHLLTGMAAPLLLVLAAPVPLLLRALPATGARRLARALRGPLPRLLTDPFAAIAVDAAGTVALYGTGLLAATASRPGLHALVTVHALLTGWLATAAVLGAAPGPHRRGAAARAVALALGMAVHDVVARALYADPPPGWAHAADGALLLSYGGDLVELAVAALLWRRWYTGRAAVRAATAAAAAPG